MSPWDIIGWLLVVLISSFIFFLIVALLVALMSATKEVFRHRRIKKKVTRIKNWRPNEKADIAEG